MKIKVADLRPNPFREIGKYPIDKAKVERLKLSISETTFWENVLCRQQGDVYEIAYGHHRLEALRGLGTKEVNMPVKKLTDAQMVRIMAEENLEWLTSPAVIYQTVMTVKNYLDGELAKYEYKDSDRFIRVLFESEHAYNQAKRKPDGVGRDTILKFLGGNWKGWMIQSAINANILSKEKKLDIKAVEEFDTIEHADNFKRVVKELDVPVNKQLDIAKKVKQNIKEKKTSSQGRTKNGKTKPSIADDVRKLAGKPKTKKAKQNAVDRIGKALNDIEKQARILADRLEGLRIDIKRLGIEELNGLKPALAKFALVRLSKELEVWKGLKNEQQGSGNRRIGGNVVG